MKREQDIHKATINIKTKKLTVTEEKQDEGVAAHCDIPLNVSMAYKSSPHKGMEDECVSKAVDKCVDVCTELAAKKGYKTITRNAEVNVFYPHKIVYGDYNCAIDRSMYRVEVECSVGK